MMISNQPLANLKSSVDAYVSSPLVSTFDKMHDDWFTAYKNGNILKCLI